MGIVKKKLSNINFAYAVEGISRKFALRREKATNKTVGPYDIPGHTYMGCVSRTVNLAGYGSVVKNRFFIRKPFTMGAPSADTIAQRNAFKVCVRWANEAWTDLNALTHNQQMWQEAIADTSKTIEGVSAAGYQTPRGWSMAVAYAIYIAGGGGSQSLPQDHKLPAFDA